MASIPLLVLNPLDAERLARIEAGGFAPHLALGAEARAAAIAVLPETRAVLTNGATGFTLAEMDALPKLEIICAIAAGHENIDVAAARARGIVVTHGPGTNAATVADHAMALMLALLRDIPRLDAAVRAGEWMGVRWPRPMVSGKRLGILGLGGIGRMIATRAAAGFGMEIAYHNRRALQACAYPWMASVPALAEWADVLLVATPGGEGTRHLVDAAALEALGPSGYLVNVGRGSVVDQAALVAALRQGRIAGAALDVVDGEPVVPAQMRGLPNLIITPHVAGRSPEAVLATAALVVANLQAHFAGRPVLTPVA